MLAIVAAATIIGVGGTLVLRARHRVLDIAQAAELVETDVRGIRSLIGNGDLASVTSEGRTYVDATEVERLSHASKAGDGSVVPGRA